MAIINTGNVYHNVSPMTTILVHNNLVKNLRSFLQVEGAHNAIITHNTIINTESTLVGYNSLVGGVGPSENWEFRDNIGNYVLYGMLPIYTDFATTWPGAVFSKNLIVDTGAVGFSTSQWGAGSILSPIPDAYADIGFIDSANNNYRLSEESVYRGVGTGGSDPGIDQDALEAALTPTLGRSAASRSAASSRQAASSRSAATNRVSV
jgi:hypothetical protein